MKILLIRQQHESPFQFAVRTSLMKFFRVDETENPLAMVNEMNQFDAVVLANAEYPDKEMEMIHLLRTKKVKVPVFLISGMGNLEIMRQAIAHQVCTIFQKLPDPDTLYYAMQKTLETNRNVPILVQESAAYETLS